ncbi:uncharacterized protein LOC134179591 [Corticium candelabrum]|uniref:uncharacterized protein LOC134179591 n=1 Tax=Corticium candelabrum TaxID=121492 RepID=UPI002E25C354|nr:uncharacterized protein LOC134179591 [Corticium candelabrum]
MLLMMMLRYNIKLFLGSVVGCIIVVIYDQGICNLEEDEQDLLAKHKRANAVSISLEQDLQQCKTLLEAGLQHCRDLERESGLRDRQIVEKLDQMSEKSSDRISRVGDIHERIQNELTTLEDFLRVVGTKRPKGDVVL